MIRIGWSPSNRPYEYIEPEPVDYTVPFYVEDVSGSENTVSINKYGDSAPTLTIEKSSDGVNWTSMGETSVAGITATVPANGKLYLRCSASTWHNNTYYANAINCSSVFNVGGNIMSLLYGSNFTGEETTFPTGSSRNFGGLFRFSNLVSASKLLLPATTLTSNCYSGMFTNNTLLTSAPKLPATTLAPYCYSTLFAGCSSLTTPPALPATTLASHCYDSLFQSCTSLTTAPVLPATTLTEWCYFALFSGCTSLTTAPALLASRLAPYCYQRIFNGCSKLNSITCLATTNPELNTAYWVEGVAETGTFIKAASMKSWPTGVDGIPEGWTVEDYK